ncbi:MFS general substrate transporter, partial [Lentithecium fluviatile CBS 122367]
MGDDFKDEESHPWTLETVVTAPTLFMGIGALLWVPLSLALGRRPVFLLAALLNFVATLGAGYSRTLRELLFFVCLLGLGEGFALTPAFLMVIDLTFIDQRPKAIAAFWSVAGFIGVSSLSLVPYFSNHGEDWHLFYRRWAPMTGSALVLAYLLYPETYFKRPTVAFNGLILLQSATEKLTVYEDHETEASPDLYKDLPGYPFAPDSKPSILQRLGLARSPFASFTSMGACYAQILFCFLNPLIFWVLLASIFNFAGMMFIGATYARILSAPPYSLPSSLLIHVNNASALGSLLGYPCAGIAVGALIKRLVKRNKGVLEAEHYLIAYILPVLAGAASTLLYGLAVHHTLHFTVYYLAYGLNGFSWVCLAIANTMWVTEAFPRWAAPALVVVNGGCYLLSFSMSFALVPWIAAHGYLLVGVELTVLQVLGGAVALPIAFWGRTARQAIHGRWAGERGGALRPL